LGFLGSMGALLIVAVSGEIALAAFGYGLITTAIFLSAIGISCVVAVRFNDKHSRAEAFDDRLTGDRQGRAIDWIVEEAEKKKK
jgi:hypothetical protein